MQTQPAKVVSIDRTSTEIKTPQAAESESRSVFDPPKMPTFLKGASRKHWKELVENLMKHQIINELDADILSMYCQAYARWLDADKELSDTSMFQKSPNGYEQYSPQFTAWRELTMMCLKIADKLGLTPPARIRLKAPAPEAQDGFGF